MTQLWNTPLQTVLKADKFDQMDWLDITGAFPKVAKANESAARDFCGQPVQDSFFSLKSADPQPAEQTPRGLEPLAELLKRGMATPEWVQLHDAAIGDNVAAAIGASAFVEGVLRNLPSEVKEQVQKAQQRQQHADKLQQEAEELNQLIEMLGEIGRDTSELEGKVQSYQDIANAHAVDAEESIANALETMDTYGPQIAAACNRAAGEASDKAQEVSAMVKAYSLAAGGDPQHIDPAMAASAMRVFSQNRNLKQLAEMLGWAKKVTRAEWRKAPKGSTTLTGYRIHDLQSAKMASSEYVAMVSDNEAVALDFTRRAAEGAISHRHYSGDDKSGRGELVIVRDESGSMSGASHSLAVAIEWSLLEIARRDKREFVSIPFSGYQQYHVWRAPKAGKGDAAGLEAHLGHFYGGGTEPYAPITQALDEIADNGLRADILIITDDEFGEPSADFMKRLQAERSKRALKVVCINIGGSGRNAAKFSDKVVNVRSFLPGDELKAAIAGVI